MLSLDLSGTCILTAVAIVLVASSGVLLITAPPLFRHRRWADLLLVAVFCLSASSLAVYVAESLWRWTR